MKTRTILYTIYNTLFLGVAIIGLVLISFFSLANAAQINEWKII